MTNKIKNNNKMYKNLRLLIIRTRKCKQSYIKKLKINYIRSFTGWLDWPHIVKIMQTRILCKSLSKIIIDRYFQIVVNLYGTFELYRIYLGK